MSKNECVEKPALKLYVVGESSGNPDEWYDWGELSLVLATNEREAAELGDCPSAAVAEVDANRPLVLLRREAAGGL